MDKWADDEIVFVSALEHYSYCPRQCALIHMENIFDENMFTIRGKLAHERVDEDTMTISGDRRIECALPIWSERLGLLGKADVVEFRSDSSVFPVEYKHGPRRARMHDDLQLCAQAMCLEEMLGVVVPVGAIYYCSSRRRREVLIDQRLREETEATIQDIRQMLLHCDLPPPANDARCRNCSLADACQPEALCTAQTLKLENHLFRPE